MMLERAEQQTVSVNGRGAITTLFGGDLSSEAPLSAGDSVVRSAAAAGSIYF